jgi:hypothetical protein
MNKKNMVTGSCQGSVIGNAAKETFEGAAFKALYSDMEEVAKSVGRRKGIDWEDLVSEFWPRFCTGGRWTALLPGGVYFPNRKFYMRRRMEKIAFSLKRKGLAGRSPTVAAKEEDDIFETVAGARAGLDWVQAVDARDSIASMGVMALDTFPSTGASVDFARIAGGIASGMSQREACREVGVAEASYREMRSALNSRVKVRSIAGAWNGLGKGSRRPAA